MQSQEAEYDTTAAAFGGETDPAKGLHIEFYSRPCKDEEASIAAGRPIFKDTEYVTVSPVGDRSNVIDRPVVPRDRRRFTRHYEAFLRKGKQVIEGTPLEQWPIITRSQVEEFKFFKVHTVEQLAEVSDVNLTNFLGGQGLKQKAIAYLEAAKGNAPLEKMQAELAARDNQIATLNQQVADLVADMAKLKTSRKD